MAFAFTSVQIAAIKRVSVATTVPEDVLAGLMFKESGGRPQTYATNPKWLYKSKKWAGASSSVRNQLRGSMAERRGTGQVRNKDGKIIRAGYGWRRGGNAYKIFHEVHDVSHYWGVRIGCWGWWAVCGLFAMRAYGGNDDAAADAFYSEFKSNPEEASIKAAISWWNDFPYNSRKKKYAHKRDWRQITIGYLGGYRERYESKLKEGARIYLKQGGKGPTPRDKSLKNSRIVLIGDSNAFYLNNEYKKHYSALGAKVLKLHWNGSGCGGWLKTLTKVADALDGKPITGSDKIAQRARKIYKFNPTNIDVTSLGGNNMGKSYKESSIQAHVNGCIKPLMQLIKRFDGTFAGPPPIGKDRVGKTGERSNSLRSKMNAAYKKAAKEVGIPYWDPTENIAYDTAELSQRKAEGRGDDIHLTPKMARQEFESRRSFLGGTSGGGGTPAPPPEKDKPKMTLKDLVSFYRAMGGTKVATTPSVSAAIAANRRRLEKILGHEPGALDKPGGISTTDASPQIEKPPDEEERRQGACPDGKFTSEYKNFQAQVPDFDFSTFYSELDKYFGSAEELLKPQGKDCVFSNEHYAAWVELQQRKQKEVPYVRESFSVLRGLIKEMKKRY